MVLERIANPSVCESRLLGSSPSHSARFFNHNLTMNTYEVQKFGVTLYMGTSLNEAEDSFKKANPGELNMYRIVGSKKHLLRRK